MNSSYNEASNLNQPLPDVEPFVYQDSLGGAATPSEFKPALQPTGTGASKSDNLPRISEEEISRLLAEARAKGIAEGINQAETRYQADLAKERERVARSILNFQKTNAEYYAKVEVELVQLSLAIAGKILHRESQIDRLVVAGLVKVMLERLQQNTKVVVRVRPEDAASWTHYFQERQGLQVLSDSTLEPGACLLETELGVANLGLSAQLKEVEQGFFDLLAHRPEANRPEANRPEASRPEPK